MTDWNHSTPLASAGAFAQAMIPLRVEGLDPTNPALDTFEQVTVSSVIATALNGINPGQAVSIDLFANLAAHALPATVTAFIVGGHSTGGLGSGIYVADSLASSALALRCPQFCAADSTGRLFRLVHSGGAIAISQGGALGGANNDQPAVQAAIDYCKAVSYPVLIFDFPVVSIWNTVRTTGFVDGYSDAWAQDGQSLCITAPIKFQGLPTRTHIKLLSTSGGSLETGWQTVAGTRSGVASTEVWRGSGINLIGGSQASPNANNLTMFEMENIWLDGGCAYTGARTAVTPATPDGPDLFNKGLRLQGTQCDEIRARNCVISGFKGEAYYVAGTTQTKQIITDCTVSGSNQSAFNPSSGGVIATNSNFGNSFIALECLGGTGSKFYRCLFYDAAQAGASGGPANGLYLNYAFPTRDPTKAPPWVDFVDCEFRNIGQMTFANYVRVTGRATDCSLTLNTAVSFGAFFSTYIDLDVTIDQMSQSPLCVVQGVPNNTTPIPANPPQTTAFVTAVSDVHIRFNIYRTPHAVVMGYYCVPFWDGGLIDQNSCSYTIGDCDGVVFARAADYGGVTSLAMPLVKMEGPTNSQSVGAGTLFGASTMPITAGPYGAKITSSRHVLQNTGAVAAVAVTITNPFTAPGGYANGQETEIFWGGAIGTTYTFARNGTGMRLNSDCVLGVQGDSLVFRYNFYSGLWHEIRRSVFAP